MIVYSDFNQNIIQVDDDGLVTFTGNTGTTYVRAQIENTDAYVIITFNVTEFRYTGSDHHQLCTRCSAEY